MRRKRIRGLIGLAVCAVILAFAAVSLKAVGSDLQYLIPAPAMEPAPQNRTQEGNEEETPVARPNEASFTLYENLKTAAEGWSGTMEAYTFSGILEKASFQAGEEEAKQGRLTALSENAFKLTPKYLRFGRLFYPEELKKGSDVILLDEQLALALFKISEPIGRRVTVSGIKFTVVGILRHTKAVGDSGDYGAYIPLAFLWDKEIQLQALEVIARPIPGAGARAIFSKTMDTWKAGGTLIDLGKEAMGALLPLRVLLFFLGMTVFFKVLAIWNTRFRWFFVDYRQRLSREYAVKLVPRLSIGILVLAAGYGVLALIVSFLIRYLVAPVYTFTEWIPAILVEWKDIQSAFWQVWQKAGQLVELKSPELSRIRFFGMLTAWFSAAAAVILTGLWVRWWTWREGKERANEGDGI